MTRTANPPEIQAKPRKRINLRQALNVNILGPIIGLILVSILFGILEPRGFLQLGNAKNILLEATIVAVAAIGTTPVIVSAGIDISIGATIAVVSVCVALMLNHHVPPALAAIGGVGVGALCGLFNGGCVTVLGLNPFIVTLGTFLAFRGAADYLSNNNIVYAPPTWINNLMQVTSHTPLVPWGVWLMLALAALLALMLRYTRFGRHIFAIGSNEQTARLCGIPVRRAKLMIYALGGVFYGIAGILAFAYEDGAGDPTTNKNTPLTAIAAAVIGGASLTGGQGSIVGALLGALFIQTIRVGCQELQLSIGFQQIVTGLIILAAVLLDRVRNPPSA